MSSWFSSWLPGLPSIDYLPLPSNIQRRFISFVLKRSLGHLLKPGQLDVQQIDSQIGSGHVQVNDLELDNQAINALLSGLPFELSDGSIGTVTARIPWPNPLTSSLGFSIGSLHLTLRLLPVDKSSPNYNVNLSDSVASYAESFIHDELHENEASLRASLQQEFPSDDGDNLPGGLDPFVVPPDESEASDADPDGVSLFATLIERLLSKFEFDATDTKITLIHPNNSRVTLTIGEICYRTRFRSTVGESDEGSGEVRSISITGITLGASDLRVPLTADSPMASGSGRARSSSSSSSSSMDEAAQWTMSQSIAFLPPRNASQASSPASSMYESALSTGRHDTNIHDLVAFSSTEVAHVDSEDGDEVFLSFGTVPVVVELTTPPVHSIGSAQASLERLQLSVKTGFISVALQPWHLCILMQLVDVFSTYDNPALSGGKKSSPSDQGASPFMLDKDFTVSVTGFALLLLSSADTPSSLDRFFDRPSSTLYIPERCVRLLVENISAEMSLTSTTSHGNKQSVSNLSLSVGDLSIFAFGTRGKGSQHETRLLAFPVLITDPLLSMQYSSDHEHPDPSAEYPNLPVFDVIDWMAEEQQSNGAKITTWRTKPGPGKFTSAHNIKAVTVAIRQTSSPTPKQTSASVTVRVVPVHVFINASQVLNNDDVSAYIEAFSSLSSRAQTTQHDDDGVGDTPPATPKERYSQDTERDRERRRLEKEVLDDLDLHHDYGIKESIPKATKSGISRKDSTKKTDPNVKDVFKLEVEIPMIRAQIRCPLHGRSNSGVVVVDVHDILVAQGNTLPSKNISFNHPSAVAASSDAALASIGFKRLLLSVSAARANKAHAVVSIGPLVTPSDKPDPAETVRPLHPKLSFVESSVASYAKSVLNLSLPSIFVDLTKESLDSLQYWIDDVSQLGQLASNGADTDSDTEKAASRNPSLIGSRFFVQSRSGSGDTSLLSPDIPPAASETVIKLQITEACIRIKLPRLSEEPVVVRPFDILGSDIDVLVELKPGGKDATVVTTSIMQLIAKNWNANDSADTLLSSVATRNLLSAPEPLLKLEFMSGQIPQTTSKESSVRLSLWGFTYNFKPDIAWVTDFISFVAAPPGAFENVMPSEKTRLSLTVKDSSIKATTLHHPGALVLHMGILKFTINLIGDSPDLAFALSVPAAGILAIDNVADISTVDGRTPKDGISRWKQQGFALLAELSDLALQYSANKNPSFPDMRILIDGLRLRLHLCADTVSAVSLFISDLVSVFNPPPEEQAPKPKRRPFVVSEDRDTSGLMSSIDDLAFKRVPEIGPAPDLIYDDLPRNMNFLDVSYGAAAGLRELDEDDFNDFPGGDETIRMLRPGGLHIVEHHFDNLPPTLNDGSSEFGETNLLVRIRNTDICLFLYDGYDWAHTRKVIQEEVKEMRKKLAKIKQLVASGQTQEQAFEETSTLLFNSVYIGLEQSVDELEPGALIAAIDEELKEDYETVSQSSWQSLRPTVANKPAASSTRLRGKRLTRSKGPSIEFRLHGLNAEFDQYKTKSPLVSRTFATVTDVEILDHIKTSTWSKFLTSLRSDSRGNVRETDSNMVKIDLRTLCPVSDHASEEARLRAKILPLRLHVDQDALDFLKKFFSFKDPQAAPPSNDPEDGIYFQLAEIFPVDLKLDYKPRRVDYRALRDGKTIELMNFFHFDGAEMTLRHITLSGITGWPRLFDLLNDLWTPDVKATQLVDVISGVAPIRSVVNVGSGIADLVLLPIAQYKKDGRIVRGVQKGTTAFVKSTAIEAIKLGARLATGTQVILEQAEGVLGTQFKQPITAEPLNIPVDDDFALYGTDSTDESAPISRYADQPVNVKEGVQSAYKTLQKNLNSAAQTILAVPMEVYERSGNEGPVHSVIRAVPIAVLKPMIGASEAVSKTLQGIHNSLDPNIRVENAAKYKH
ncbi:autophagy-related protein 2 [Stygiomarasmius scandens]|uniref:Autophagy-related protein 2 n=1 Tax=Marasmiellus scandens TaxID=2682957 RepID=A0ABR1JTL3_9AGAR